MSRADTNHMPTQQPVARRWVPRVAVSCFAIYAAFLLAEFVAVGAFSIPGEVLSSFVIYGLCVAPVVGLALLVRAAHGTLSVLTCSVLVLTTTGGALLIFYALHLAPPDALNGVVVMLIALIQFAALIVLGAIWGIGRWRRRHNDVPVQSGQPKKEPS